jgi:hypothetical protein
VDTSRERDQSIERLLRQSLQTPRQAGVTDSCLDAETLAAWVDGGLSGAALEMAQTHVADCVRCQSLVGTMARAHAVVSQPEPERARRPWLAWAVPLTAAALAVAVWIAVPRDLGTPVPRPSNLQREAAETKAAQPASPDEKPPEPVAAPVAAKEELAASAPSNTVEPQAPAPELRKDTAPFEADRLRQEDTAAAPAANAPPPAAAQTPSTPSAARQGVAGGRLAESVTVTGESPTIEIVSPDRSVRWRISGSVLEHSTDGGSSWDRSPTNIDGQLTSASAPSTSVCWVVGRGGVVLLSTDGRTWRRVAFPEMTDLSAVRATDARTASVSTADGRIFSTSDGGATWERR